MVKKQILAIGIALALIGGCHIIQRILDYNYPAPPAVEDFKYLPKGSFLKGAALGFDEVFADYLWIQALGYFGGHIRTDQQFPWLEQLIDTATTLDPYFQDPYEFGGVVFESAVGDIDKSIAIFEKGMEAVPKHHKRYWYLPFFAAFDYMYYKQDYQKAGEYLKFAASLPGRPEYLPLLVGRVYANTGDPAIAVPFLEQMKESASTPEMKEKLEKRIKEVSVRKHVQIIEQARDMFVKRENRLPFGVQELVQAGVLQAMPIEPFGGYYLIDSSDGAVFTSSKIDDMTIHGLSGEKIEVKAVPIEK